MQYLSKMEESDFDSMDREHLDRLFEEDDDYDLDEYLDLGENIIEE